MKPQFSLLKGYLLATFFVASLARAAGPHEALNRSLYEGVIHEARTPRCRLDLARLMGAAGFEGAELDRVVARTMERYNRGIGGLSLSDSEQLVHRIFQHKEFAGASGRELQIIGLIENTGDAWVKPGRQREIREAIDALLRHYRDEPELDLVRAFGKDFTSIQGIKNMRKGLADLDTNPIFRKAHLPGSVSSPALVKPGEKESLHQYADEALGRLKRRSSRVRGEIATAQRQNKPYVVDVVGVGAGPHNAIAFAAMKEANPDIDALIFEAGDNVGVFDAMGKGFRVNTFEAPGISGNHFPATPIQVCDCNPGSEGYVPAEVFGYVTRIAHDYADNKIVFRERVEKITEMPAGAHWPARYKIHTSNGLEVYANKVVIGTGLGSPSAKISDQASLDLVRSEYRMAEEAIREGKIGYAPGIQSVDHLLESATREVRLDQTAHPMTKYRGKRVVVIGSGDGGNIAVEGLGGLTEGLNPLDLAKEDLPQITWLGQKINSKKDFLESIYPRKRARYGKIGDLYEKGALKGQPGRLEKIEKVTRDGKQVYVLSYRVEKNAPLVTIEADHVVFATGYDDAASPLLKGLAHGDSKPELKGLYLNPEEFTNMNAAKKVDEVAKRVVTGDVEQDVYVVGNAANVEVLESDWRQTPGGFLDILGARSAATGQVIGKSVLKPIHGKTPRLPVAFGPGKVIGMTRALPISQIKFKTDEESLLHARTAMARLMKEFVFEPRKEIKLTFTMGGEKILQVSGPDAASANNFYEGFRKHSDVLDVLGDQFARGNDHVTVKMTTRSNGTPRIESLEIDTSAHPVQSSR